VTVPAGLMDVSNGRLRRTVENPDGSRTFEWFVTNPINNYGINVNIADYAHFSDVFKGEKGDLTLDYYVLPANLEKAKKQFQQVKPMLQAFEHWFGPYPFYEDGYKLVEVPYLGMEHQSSVTYGNQYRNGYLGKDLSGTGWGDDWDFIIIHESGHEWFANNITYRDVADMWVHESFTNYSECLYVEYHHGKAAGAAYVIGCRKLVQNRKPIVGIYGVNHEGSGDMYYKGGNMLHTIRQVVDNDALWRDILRGLNKDFYHQTVDGAQVEAYMSEKSGKKLDKIFDQYLRDTRIPLLEVQLDKGNLTYRWINCVPGFDMPVQVTVGKDKYAWIRPTTEWQTVKCSLKKAEQFRVDEDFYVEVKVRAD
jgi:aminopeptidase N